MTGIDPPPEQPLASESRSGLLGEAFPSLGIGLFVGVLVALSLTPVVAGLLTTLGGLLAAMLGLQQEPGSEGGTSLSRLRMNGARIGAFGFAAVLGLALGLYARNHDVFTAPVKDQIASWQEAGYSPEEARQFVALQRFGLTPEGREIVQGDLQKTQMSALFGALSDVDLCDRLSTGRFNDDPERIASAYRRLDAGDATDRRTPLYRAIGELAGRVERLPAAEQAGVFRDVESIVCAIQQLEAR
jgi:hypothetical protein